MKKVFFESDEFPIYFDTEADDITCIGFCTCCPLFYVTGNNKNCKERLLKGDYIKDKPEDLLKLEVKVRALANKKAFLENILTRVSVELDDAVEEYRDKLASLAKIDYEKESKQ